MVVTSELMPQSTTHGQKYLEALLDDALIGRVASMQPDIVATLDKESAIVFSTVSSTRVLPMPISNHEIAYAAHLKSDLELLRYLGFRYRFYIAGRDKIVFEAPPYLLIEPVSVCNLRCPMCFQVDKSFTRKPFMGVMAWELFTKIVDEAAELGVGAITLASRGEPTMHPRFVDMLKYIADKDCFWELKVNTNATLLTPEIARAIFSCGVTQFVISGDHYEKAAYERLRFKADFDKVLANVISTWDVRRREFPGCHTEIRVSGVRFDEPLEESEFVNFWRRYSDAVTLAPAIKRWDTYNNKPHEEISSPCIFLWDRMYVWFDGKTNPCDEDYKSNLSYGNINNVSIKEAWRGEKISQLRTAHLNRMRSGINPCDRCGLDFE